MTNKIIQKQSQKQGQKHKKGGNRKKDQKRKERDEREERELEELEEALLDQTTRIIEQLMTVITTRINERGYSYEEQLNRTRLDNYSNNSTYERLYGNKSYQPQNHHNQEDNKINESHKASQNASQNVTMNIQHPRNMTEMTQESNNVVLPGGAQLLSRSTI